MRMLVCAGITPGQYSKTIYMMATRRVQGLSSLNESCYHLGDKYLLLKLMVTKITPEFT